MTLTFVTVVLTVLAVRGQESTMPPPVNTSFSCRGRDTGFYADIENDCEVYHTCDNHGNKFTYYCPEETKFRQETLVCDHAHLVNCKNAEKLIAKVAQDRIDVDDKLDSFRSSSAFSRTYRISPEPSVFLEAPRDSQKKSTTFTMSSTVFLRNSNRKIDNSEKSVFSTTARPFNFNYKFRDSEFPAFEKSRNPGFDVLRGERNFGETKVTTSKPFFFRDNYPYRETLRSIQNKTEKIGRSTTSTTTTTERTTTAGTEFPVPAFNGALAGIGDEDPYYPKRPTTEIYYTLKREKIHKPYRFSATRGPFSSAELKIPDVLPDFNTVDDLVDRRKILYIPRTKSL